MDLLATEGFCGQDTHETHGKIERVGFLVNPFAIDAIR